MAKMSALFAAMLAVMATTTAYSADLPVKARPYVTAPASRVVKNDCAYLEIKIVNWEKPVTFRVRAYGGATPNGMVETPVTVPAGATEMCVPKAFFLAKAVEICVGTSSRDSSNAWTIANSRTGNWMDIARARLARGNVVNPGQPHTFRYNGPTQKGSRYGEADERDGYRRPNQNQRPRPIVSDRMLGSMMSMGTGILIGRSMR